MDRLDTPPSIYRPYHRTVLGVTILHIIIGAPLDVEKIGQRAFSDDGLAGLPLPCRAIR